MDSFLVLVVMVTACMCQRNYDQSPQEELCRARSCGDEECRVLQTCRDDSCSLQAICVPPSDSELLSGGCRLGEPLLRRPQGGRLSLVPCFTSRPCPPGFYCSTLLQDVSSRCCRSNTASPPTAGTCPDLEPAQFLCVDGCLTDGDCNNNEKCCRRPCSAGGSENTCVYIPREAPPPPPSSPPPTTTTTTTTTTRRTPASVGFARLLWSTPTFGRLRPLWSSTSRGQCPDPKGPYRPGECTWTNRCWVPFCSGGRQCCPTEHCGKICRYPDYP